MEGGTLSDGDDDDLEESLLAPMSRLEMHTWDSRVSKTVANMEARRRLRRSQSMSVARAGTEAAVSASRRRMLSRTGSMARLTTPSLAALGQGGGEEGSY